MGETEIDYRVRQNAWGESEVYRVIVIDGEDIARQDVAKYKYESTAHVAAYFLNQLTKDEEVNL